MSLQLGGLPSSFSLQKNVKMSWFYLTEPFLKEKDPNLLPPRTQLSIKGIAMSMKNLPPTLPGCGTLNLVKNCKRKIWAQQKRYFYAFLSLKNYKNTHRERTKPNTQVCFVSGSHYCSHSRHSMDNSHSESSRFLVSKTNSCLCLSTY